MSTFYSRVCELGGRWFALYVWGATAGSRSFASRTEADDWVAAYRRSAERGEA